MPGRPHEMDPAEIALAIDFYQRLCYRRTPEQRKAFTNPSDVGRKLHGLRQLLTEPLISELDVETQVSLGESLEFLAIRSEQAAEPAQTRLQRYAVVAKNPPAAGKAV